MFVPVVIAILCLAFVAKGSDNHDGTGSRVLWRPSDGRSREEWMHCNGLPAESCSRMPNKLKRLIEVTYDQPIESSSALWVSNTVDGCILLTVEQLDYMIAEAEYKRMIRTDHSRWKRQTLNFTAFPYNKWPLPIVYKFDGTHNSTEQAIIQDAVQLWENQTCLRFSEISTDTNYTDHHILFSKPSTSTCNSYVGRVIYIPQLINLGEGCLSSLAVPVHEIGHAIGLWHEQQRTDRDDHVIILQGNIPESSYAVNYEMQYTTLLVPYHFGSVMHYYDGAFAYNSTLHTMQALNPLYQQNMGQYVEIAFDDARAINIAYNCDSLQCSGSPGNTCQRGGYRDPNKCASCKCPDGIGGMYCDRVADPVNAVCGGLISLNETESVTIQSPGYESPGYYNNFQECSWLISCPSNCQLTLQFVNLFDLLCSTTQGCLWHWVEVKYKRDLDLEGARFCCRTRPDVNITSESSEMLVIFKTNYEWQSRARGFRAVITVGALEGATDATPLATTNITKTPTTSTLSHSNSSTSSSTSSTTTTTTTTTTTISMSTLSLTSTPPLSMASTANESDQLTTSYSGSGCTILAAYHSALICMFLGVIVQLTMMNAMR